MNVYLITASAKYDCMLSPAIYQYYVIDVWFIQWKSQHCRDHKYLKCKKFWLIIWLRCPIPTYTVSEHRVQILHVCMCMFCATSRTGSICSPLRRSMDNIVGLFLSQISVFNRFNISRIRRNLRITIFSLILNSNSISQSDFLSLL